MKLVSAEGVDPYIYFPKGEEPPTVAMGYQVCDVDEYMRQNLWKLPSVRLILIPSILSSRRGKAYAYYLHWETADAIRDLDIRVEEDRYTDADFAPAVKTLHSETICFSCKRKWHTLIMPPGDAYLGAPGLTEKKIASRINKLVRCPACGGSLRELVVMVIEEARSPDN